MTRDRDLTRDRDIERVLEHWLTDGVNVMPDRVYQSIFDRVERQPQALAPRLLRRLPEMNGSLRWIAAAAAVLLIAVVGFALLGRPIESDVGGSPSATPSPSPSVGVVDPVPTELQAGWMGADRPVPGFVASAGRMINFTPDGRFYITQSNQNEIHVMNAVASSVEDGQFRLETEQDDGRCSAGDMGIYGWSLVPSGRILTVTPSGDDCPVREAVVPGTWWLQQCETPDDNCLGDVDAGTYQSQFFTPLLADRNSWVPDYGALTYTVPEGWANTADWPDEFVIQPQGSTPDLTDVIHLRSRVVLASQAEDCPAVPLEGVARTPQAMAEWLASHPGLESSTPEPVTIGGFEGFAVDIAMAPTWTKTCPFSDGAPSLPLFTDYDPGGFLWDIRRDGRMRIYLVDLGDGRLFWADVEGHDEATFQSMLPEASAIVESMEFSSTP